MAPLMAVKVQKRAQDVSSLRAAEPVRRMNRDFQIRFTAILLALLTTAAVVYAGYNFQAENQFQVPDDGVWWVEHQGRLTADRVELEGPGTRAGIKVGDQLTAIDQRDTNTAAARTRELYRVGAWSKATYSLVRKSVPVDVVLIPVPADRSQNNWLRLIGLIYLGIGLYVLLRRWTAPGSTHFYIFCLVSFIAYSFKYTGKLNDFDWTIYWGNIAAGILQVAIRHREAPVDLLGPERGEHGQERPPVGTDLPLGVDHLVENAGQRPIARQQPLQAIAGRLDRAVGKDGHTEIEPQIAFLRSSVSGYSIERSSGGSAAIRPGVWP